MIHRQYFVYITTNENKKVLYTGVTNNLLQRITEHYLDRNIESSFAGKYKSYYLLHYEVFKYIDKAIMREKGIKGWTRKKKEVLINGNNSGWKFLNKEIFEEWPPREDEAMKRSEKE